MDHNHNLPSERNPMSKPQVYVHLEFGLSWSQRHSPRTHTVTYTSRNLRDSRASRSFPRQLPPPNTNFLTVDNRQQRPGEQRDQVDRYHQQQQQYHHHQSRLQQPQAQHERDYERPRDQGRASRPRPGHEQEHGHERRESRSESRGLSHERGKSAPPPFHGSPWDTEPGPSASLFPSGPQTSLEQPSLWKPLPAAPSRFRLGEDGLPWSAWAWPADPHAPSQSEEGDDDEPPYANQPTTVRISPERRRHDDPERTRELESLSAAMMTVDNGFENQWWFQGPKESMSWWPRDQEEPSRLSMADAMLLSAAEPPATAPPHGWYAPTIDDRSSYLGDLVSPISNTSGSPSRPLQRSMTTRSEELFLTSPR
ncbi:hypothetical protein JX265_009118 [Neoarthrinium moseri]|uniref:Uncharacterized protein n=1 Tax=Neoarthrinium moseri TaxID=1658444 RepID=A0A9P9WGK5_9PEZI|nr:uncharacterized protein JN550_013793 [Neoarthrinium moseri]KAI1847688.1 hypothetical protein JX266_006183 [Neoarthrinium moseri]KAI1856480.1 hypothetical protein JN550_013793 [Neoarthrinium moseri]KAI1862404.1 hypothetical protein JX265_009118 [Neoarthrinium moseri]